MGEIVVFSKGSCPHCIAAKELLGELEIPFTEVDIHSDVANSMLMSMASGRHTVPQIFFNNEHIGGTTELRGLGRDELQARARRALLESSGPAFLQTSPAQDHLAAAIVPIKDILGPHLPQDPTAVPEYEAVRVWYRSMFGFLCNCYDQMVIRPEPMALWIGALSSMMSMVEKQTNVYFGMSCLATAFAANCSYCSAHGVDLAMKYGGQAPDSIKALFDFLRQKRPLDSLPFEPRLQAIVNLSAGMTTQSLSVTDMEHARAAVGIAGLRDLVTSVGAMGGIMGFLNRWNDLIGVEIEASIKQTIDHSALAADWQWGTHDTEDLENRHDYRDPQSEVAGPPTKQQFKALTDQVLNETFEVLQPLHEKFAAFDEELLPAWVGDYPEAHAVRSVSALYHAAFNTGDLDPAIKHLAAWVLATGSGHPGIAREERRILARLTSDILPAQYAALERFATTGQLAADVEISAATLAAIHLARVAQEFPHVVRGGLVRELDEAMSPKQIVELVVALAVVGMGQRWNNVQNAYRDYVQAPAKT